MDPGAYINDGAYMQLAIEQALEAERQHEVPIGAVIVLDGEIIASAYNRRELDQDPVAHAELLALRQAAKAVGSWRLPGATLYVTLEPCTMCAGALVLSRVSRLVFGCRDPKAGAVRSLFTICEDERLNHRLEVVEGVEAEACSKLLSDFFAKVRRGEITKPGKAGAKGPKLKPNT